MGSAVVKTMEVGDPLYFMDGCITICRVCLNTIASQTVDRATICGKLLHKLHFLFNGGANNQEVQLFENLR